MIWADQFRKTACDSLPNRSENNEEDMSINKNDLSIILSLYLSIYFSIYLYIYISLYSSAVTEQSEEQNQYKHFIIEAQALASFWISSEEIAEGGRNATKKQIKWVQVQLTILSFQLSLLQHAVHIFDISRRISFLARFRLYCQRYIWCSYCMQY